MVKLLIKSIELIRTFENRKKLIESVVPKNKSLNVRIQI